MSATVSVPPSPALARCVSLPAPTVLTGDNDYSGATQVLGGRLIAGSSGGFSANSDYTVASGAVLEVAGGFGTVADDRFAFRGRLRSDR